ncbi:hypothetical protein C6Y45_14940 [Alkalicoccus saliphilus]|uniref:Alkyl hydroperoxide reductase subunit C/ Thiol specific antioxidant domain-containing protein n=1 Tax=Alkalicoccus saliphilus TaxID=200989 RepID=A0A2T4U2T3_9BACI|nr:hypothetical protein C6Y45_14940 [Alkalicoccus saliphilus]
MNEFKDEIEELGYNLYGISPSDPDSHQALAEENDLDFDLLSDTSAEIGLSLEFIDEEEQMIYRGMIAVQPETGEMAREIDYLAGDEREEVLEVLEEMNP